VHFHLPLGFGYAGIFQIPLTLMIKSSVLYCNVGHVPLCNLLVAQSYYLSWCNLLALSFQLNCILSDFGVVLGVVTI